MQSGIEAAAESVANELNGMQQDISAVGDKVAYGLSEVGEAMEGKLVLAEESLIAVGGAVGGAVHQLARRGRRAWKAALAPCTCC